MKLLPIICLLLIGLSIQSEFGQQGRDFLQSFLSTLKGGDFQLNDECLGKNFELDFQKLEDAINSENVLLAAAIGKKLIGQLEKSCPGDELKQVIDDLNKFYYSGKAFDKIIMHAKDIIIVVKEAMNKAPYTPATLGEFLGKFLKIVLYQPTRKLTFLALEDESQQQGLEVLFPELREASVEELVDGFFEGVSSVPVDQNQCIQDIQKDKKDIVLAFQEIINAVRTRTHIPEAIWNFYKLTAELKASDAHCHFSTLEQEIKELDSTTGLMELAYRLFSHMPTVENDVQAVVSHFESKEFRQCGVSLGAVVKILLNYSTI